MILLRAINNEELIDFLKQNNLKDANDINQKELYMFKIYKHTIWVSKNFGAKRYNVFNIAISNKNVYSRVVVSFKIWLAGKYFSENKKLLEYGKYYCVKEHMRMVKAQYIK